MILHNLSSGTSLYNTPAKGLSTLRSICLYNGRFIDVESATSFPEKTCLIIRNGRIAALDAQIQPTAFDGQCIDLKGKTVLPGFFNTHCHLQLVLPNVVPDLWNLLLVRKYKRAQQEYTLKKCISCGVTNVRDTWTPDLWNNRDQADLGPRIHQAVAVGPFGGYLTEERGIAHRFSYLFMNYPYIDYQKNCSGVVTFSSDSETSEVRQAVDRAIDERGAECIKLGDQRQSISDSKKDLIRMTQAQMDALVDQARKRGIPTTVHHCDTDSVLRCCRAGVTSIAHITQGGRLTPAMVQKMLDCHVIMEPTLSVSYDFCYAVKGHKSKNYPHMKRLRKYRKNTIDKLIKNFWISPLRSAVRQGYQRLDQGKMRGGYILDLSDLFIQTSGLVLDGIDNMRLLFEMGVPLACGNDGGMPPCTIAMVGHELSMFDFYLNESHKTPLFTGADALRVLTINSARAMGVESEFGSLSVGKVADLVIVEGDPLTSPELLGQPVSAVFMSGRLIFGGACFDMH